MRDKFMWKFLEGAAVGAGLLAASAGSQVHADLARGP
jgi:hypothetical protein